MPFLFSKAKDAIQSACDTRTYAVCYSEEEKSNSGIHLHDCCEILLCLSGGNSFLIDGKIYEAKNGDLFILNQYEPHIITTDTSQTFARFVMQIHPDYLKSQSTLATDLSYCFYNRGDNVSNKISLSDKEIAEFEKLFVSFRVLNDFGEDVLKNAAANKLLVLVNQLFLKRSGIKRTTNEDDRIIESALSYINEHYFEDLTLEKLAKVSYISVNQLCKLFKSRLNTTAAKYIITKRIAEAKKLLAEGKSVAETATLCGFQDYANFIRVFKKFVGTPPGKYSKL